MAAWDQENTEEFTDVFCKKKVLPTQVSSSFFPDLAELVATSSSLKPENCKEKAQEKQERRELMDSLRLEHLEQ